MSGFTPPQAPTGFVFDRIKAIDGKGSPEKWDYWISEFSKCIKCYACRQVCSLCYCERCITEKNMPQWIETSAHPRGNLSWNITRAMHLVGRCTSCGECERACPVGIPLNVINQKMTLVVKDAFNYRAGYDEKTHPPMIVFSPDDRENFIK
jgi:succinate dehydrogenase/fumarate reductase-like Fe-S protein